MVLLLKTVERAVVVCSKNFHTFSDYDTPLEFVPVTCLKMLLIQLDDLVQNRTEI
jgi:hypothetical protein